MYFYLSLFAFIVFGIFGYGIGKIYGMSIYPDEFGYWANAAQAAGYDWREIVSLGSYYSYGYSIPLFPVLKFAEDGVAAYRIAVFVNVLAQAGAPFLAWGIYRRLFPKAKGVQLVMAAGMTALYPVWSFYSQMTLAESLLCFLYLLGCYFFVRYLESGNTAMLLATVILLIYMYMVHMRTIGIMAAFMGTLLVMFWQRQERRDKLMGIFLLAGCGIALTALGKKYVSESVYAMGDAELLAATSYNGKLCLIIQALTGERTITFLLGCAGKLYYLLMASFGMLIPAALFLVRYIKKMIIVVRRKEKPAWQSFFAVFVTLSFLGQFAIAALYMSGGDRLDIVFYGRYNEYLVPLMIGLGALELLQGGNFRKICLCGGTVGCVLFGITYYALDSCGADVIQGDFAAGINYITGDWNYTIETDFVKSFLLNIVLVCIVIICLYAARSKRSVGMAMAVTVMMEAGLALALGGKYTYRYNEINYADIRLCECLAEEENPMVYYLEEGDYQYIDLVQFTLREIPIHVIRCGEVLEVEKGGYLFVRMDSSNRDRLEKNFSVVEESGHFVLMKKD